MVVNFSKGGSKGSEAADYKSLGREYLPGRSGEQLREVKAGRKGGCLNVGEA